MEEVPLCCKGNSAKYWCRENNQVPGLQLSNKASFWLSMSTTCMQKCMQISLNLLSGLHFQWHQKVAKRNIFLCIRSKCGHQQDNCSNYFCMLKTSFKATEGVKEKKSPILVLGTCRWASMFLSTAPHWVLRYWSVWAQTGSVQSRMELYKTRASSPRPVVSLVLLFWFFFNLQCIA